jgi:hypothetical protein
MPAAGRQNVNTDKIMSDRVPGICTMESEAQAINWVHQPQQVAHTGSRPDQQPPECKSSLLPIHSRADDQRHTPVSATVGVPDHTQQDVDVRPSVSPSQGRSDDRAIGRLSEAIVQTEQPTSADPLRPQ